MVYIINPRGQCTQLFFNCQEVSLVASGYIEHCTAVLNTGQDQAYS